jgi:HD-GYP domain-containing protein (c-di-GMP phosphodiesterase class II)
MTILDIVSNYCQEHLSISECAKLPFHNLQHTLEVVERVKLIAQNCSLSSEETELILIAARFHDTGFSST